MAAEEEADWDLAARIIGNYAADAAIHQGLARAADLMARGIAMCDAHGLRSTGFMLRTSEAGTLVDAGRLDEAVALIDGVVDAVEASGDVISAAYLRGFRSQIAITRGDVSTAIDQLPAMLAAAEAHSEQDDLHPVRIQAAAVLAAIGEGGDALRLLETVIDDPSRGMNLELYLAPAVRLAISLGDRALAERAVADVTGSLQIVVVNLRTANAAIAEARGEVAHAGSEYLDLVRSWTAVDLPFEAGLASLGAARCLTAIGDVAGAATALAAARARLEALAAAPALAEVAALEATVLRRGWRARLTRRRRLHPVDAR